MKIYGVKVFPLGTDSPTTFYFKSEEKAHICYNAYDAADDITTFDNDDFPLDMLSDHAF